MATNFDRFRPSLGKEVRMFMTMRTPKHQHVSVELTNSFRVCEAYFVLLGGPLRVSEDKELPQHPRSPPPPPHQTPTKFPCKEIPAPVFGAHVVWSYRQLTN